MELEKQEAHAARLLSLVVEDPEYSLVYEDEILAEADEDVQRSILELMASAIITVSWPDSEDIYVIAGTSDD